ncbi:mitochondrial K+-H+ exchange-related-domain-containing protein [Lyophyllum atratum]|nr:mitochondrial K+-H+ exchange-related-domain-containing protein [Lyophyllum atratum]
MSIAPKALRKLRIIAIPLTRPKIKASPSTAAARPLTYYQFQISPPTPPTPQPSEGEGSRSRWIPEGGIVNWVSTKAGDTWAGFGKAEGGWKLKVFQVGERLVDRLEFEELALKGINPALGPSIADVSGQEKQAGTRIPLIYPPSITTDSVTLDELRALVAYRTPRHRKGFYMWMVIAPFMAPFMIIPIIPNLPFFFCAWRSWSHYKAYRASQYLQGLLDSGVIVPEASEALDGVYKEFSPNHHLITSAESLENDKNEATSKPESKPLQHEVLLTRDAVPAILNIFGLGSSAGADLLRAVEQARVRVQSGRSVL